MNQTNVTDTKIKVNNLNFYYGAFHALKNVSMDIPPNKVTAFIGPSGCGKSTLLRTFNRLYELYPGQRAEGEISLDGENILDKKQDVTMLRTKVGMVFQKPTPFPMSIYDNIAFGVRLYEELSRNEMDNRIEWALSKAALWKEVKDKLNQSGNSLSGGQQQRLCIARGIAIKPEVLLLDDEAFACGCVEAAISTLAVADLLQMSPDALLKHLEAVFGVLRVELGQVRDRTDGSQDCVVFDEGRLGAERRDHGDPFIGTKSTESLMLDIPALEDNCTTLWIVSSLSSIEGHERVSPCPDLALS